MLEWIPLYERQWLLPDFPCGSRPLGSNGAGGNGLRRKCWCTSDKLYTMVPALLAYAVFGTPR